jgi:ElaB/YqjD/DUF883 family membrane-anchored ribosome-binding protein
MASAKAKGENRKRKPSASSVSPVDKNSPSIAGRGTAKKIPKQYKNMGYENKMAEGASKPPEPENKMESGASHARKAAEDLRSAAGAVAEEYRGRAEEVWNDATNRVRTFQDDTEQYVRENPTKAVFTALGIGFVLGLIFRR